jgi:hypothetical protein
MVRAGGEVDEDTLATRIQAAEQLVFLVQGNCLRGVAALKNPHSNYRRSVSQKTGCALNYSEFPYELGYIFIMPSARGGHLSRPLVQAALSHAGSAGVWATSRIDHYNMHKTLIHCAFTRSGQIYESPRDKQKIQLFTRAPALLSSQLAKRHP